jgi:hypothetical protein
MRTGQFLALHIQYTGAHWQLKKNAWGKAETLDNCENAGEGVFRGTTNEEHVKYMMFLQLNTSLHKILLNRYC